jgi:hypothetical protein
MQHSAQREFQGRRVSVYLQDRNGPCALLALANVLSLRGELPAYSTSTQLPDALAALILEKRDVDANVAFLVDDALDLLPKLQSGMLVNPQLDRVDGFEYTRELAVFDLLHIRLLHGWVLDPGSRIEGGRSYNQVVDRLLHGNDGGVESVLELTSE